MPLFQLPWSRFPHPSGKEPSDKRRLGPRLWLAVGGVLLALLAVAAIALGPGFVRGFQQRSLRLAQDDLRQQNYRQAWLRLEQAVQSNAEDFQARRQLAEFYDEAGLPQALAQWRELVRLEPANDANRFGLARTALRLGDLSAAREAIVGVTGRGQLDYHRLSAAIASRTGDATALTAELTELSRLEPDNLRTQFNLAAVELASGAPDRAAAAVRRLETLARGEPLRIRATLELIRVASRQGPPGSYIALAKRILPPRSRAPLAFSWTLPSRGLPELIAYMENQPQPDPDDAVRLTEWMCRQGLASAAAFWLDTLAPALQATAKIQAARATCLVQMKDWRGVAAAVRAGAWGQAPDDALDLAFAAHSQMEWMHPEHARDTWSDALDVAGRSHEGLHVLLLLAAAFDWRDEVDATLWRLARSLPEDASNWERLAALATADGSTQKLYDIYDAWAHAAPGNLTARGGFAWLAAVLDRGGEEDADPRDAANSGWIAAKALRLRRLGRAADGLALLAGLSPAAQNDTRPALVRGLLLSDLGRRAESERALAQVEAVLLLSEEHSLVEAARAKNHS